jgi:hypothetical protein
MNLFGDQNANEGQYKNREAFQSRVEQFDV